MPKTHKGQLADYSPLRKRMIKWQKENARYTGSPASLSRFAAVNEIQPATLSKVLAGKQDLSMASVLKLMDFWQCEPGEIFRRKV